MEANGKRRVPVLILNMWNCVLTNLPFCKISLYLYTVALLASHLQENSTDLVLHYYNIVRFTMSLKIIRMAAAAPEISHF